MALDILALQRIHRHGSHDIIVQKTSLIHRMQYGLIIDGVKHDQIDALAGTFALHGVMEDASGSTPVAVVIRQGFFTGTYYCVINGVAIRMERYRHAVP